MRILVLGGGRFQGKRAVEMLVAAGHDVVVYNHNAAAPVAGAGHVAGDRRDQRRLRGVLASHDWDAVIDNIAYSGRDVRILLPLLQGRVRRYVLISSYVVYHGIARPAVDLAEERADLSLRTGHEYDDGKREGELALVESGTTTPWTALRFPKVYGEDDPSDWRGFFIARVADQRGLLLPSETDEPFQSLWRDDAAKAAVLAATTSGTQSRAYNVAGDEVFTITEWLWRLAAIVGGSPPPIVRLPLADLRTALGLDYEVPMPKRPLLDTSAIRQDLGFTSTASPLWLPRVVAWWLHSGLEPAFWQRRPQEVMTIEAVLRGVRSPKRGA